jgi:hypothetical protein
MSQGQMNRPKQTQEESRQELSGQEESRLKLYDALDKLDLVSVKGLSGRLFAVSEELAGIAKILRSNPGAFDDYREVILKRS